MPGDVRPTAESVLNSGLHGRQRREERNIQKIDLQRARRYGMEEPARNGRIKYTFGGVVFIYDPCTNREVTSYKSKDAAPDTSGTKMADPVILQKKKEYEDKRIIAIRGETHNFTRRMKRLWTSHSVLVVDMSGSMRRDDVNGARCRSDGVFMSIARDYVEKPLKNKTRSKNDLISLVLMREDADIVLKHEMTDWVLYNKLIDLRNWTEERPAGPGNYMPALEAAENLLMKNQSSTCSLSLMFFSDGKPSDRGEFSKKMGSIASKFGRRLSVACIGMADEGEDFSILNEMVDEATSYGAIASFGKPSLDADSLSNIITNLASSLTTSKTEMTNIETGVAKEVRMDIVRDRKDAPDDQFLTSDWKCYSGIHLQRIWSWSTKLNTFVEIIDSRCGNCREQVRHANCYLCDYCDAFVLCSKCENSTNIEMHRYTRQCSSNISKVRSGKLVKESVPSFSIAMKDQIFGEGAERIVRKCRFLDAYKEFMGPVMVAKESRFVDKYSSDYRTGYVKRMEYHEEFMRTQSMAEDMAKQFNGALDSAVQHFEPESQELLKEQMRNMPRIKFLKPLVVETVLRNKEFNVLVEPMLEGEYKKFNDNMGMVLGRNISVSVDALSSAMENLDIGEGLASGGLGLGLGLGIIAEEDCEEEEDSDDEIIEEQNNAPKQGSYSIGQIKDALIPQAFSHFSYEKSKKYFMVVDLQGVLKTNTDGTKCYMLTDPVIHKRRLKKKRKLKNYTFGRTVSSSDRTFAALFNYFLILLIT